MAELRTEAFSKFRCVTCKCPGNSFINLGPAIYYNTGKIDSLPTYSWQDETFGKGTIFNAEMSVQGGSQNVNYYLSGSYSKQTAFIAPTIFNVVHCFLKLV